MRRRAIISAGPLSQQGIVEPVADRARQDLPLRIVVPSRKFRKLQRLGLRSALEEFPHLCAVLLREYRARGVQQFTTGGEHPPQGVEQLRLRAAERGDVGSAPQPLDVGVAPYDARGLARRVQDRKSTRLNSSHLG